MHIRKQVKVTASEIAVRRIALAIVHSSLFSSTCVRGDSLDLPIEYQSVQEFSFPTMVTCCARFGDDILHIEVAVVISRSHHLPRLCLLCRFFIIR